MLFRSNHSGKNGDAVLFSAGLFPLSGGNLPGSREIHGAYGGNAGVLVCDPDQLYYNSSENCASHPHGILGLSADLEPQLHYFPDLFFKSRLDAWI